MAHLIKNLKKFKQPLSFEGLEMSESITGVYEISNKYLLIIETLKVGEGLKESKLQSLKNICDTWNAIEGRSTLEDLDYIINDIDLKYNLGIAENLGYIIQEGLDNIKKLNDLEILREALVESDCPLDKAEIKDLIIITLLR
jgi:hypothetical protein